METKPRILVICDGNAPTGFSRVAESLLSRLHHRFEFHHLARIYRGDPHPLPWKLYAAGLGSDRLGLARIDELIGQVRPRIVLTIADLWDQAAYLEALAKHASRTKLVTYSPVEAEPVDRRWLGHANMVSRFVLYTEFARVLVTASLDAQSRPPIEVIPHGVDTRVFRPLECGKSGTKAELGLFRDSSVEGSFVVLNANRNQPRKRIDLTVRSFAAFAKGKPGNVKLYLHMGFRDAGWDIFDLCRKHGVEDRLIATHAERDVPSIPDDALNLIYNAADVGINTSVCEGWGLANLEHGATRTAQIVTRMPTLQEIWKGAAQFANVCAECDLDGSLFTGRVADISSIASILERLYGDIEFRSTVADRCFKVATQMEYSWDTIAERWADLFREVLSTYLD